MEPATTAEAPPQPPQPEQAEPPENNPDTPPEKPEPDLSAPPAHRPLKFKTVKILQEQIDAYFDWADPHVEDKLMLKLRSTGEQYHSTEKVITKQKPYTIHGLARKLDTTRETLRDYESGIYDDQDIDSILQQSFSDTITRAKARIAEYAETQLYVAGASHGAQFNLKNNYAWKDETEVVNKNVRASEELDELDDPVEARDNVAAQAARALADQITQVAEEPPEVLPDAQPGPTPTE